MLSAIWRRWLKRRGGPRRECPTHGRRPVLYIEMLESRDLLSAAQPFHVVMNAPGSTRPAAASSPNGLGFSPSQVRHAYGFDQITFANGTIQGDGTGQTIAIVDAFDAPTVAADLHTFDVAFGLPDPVFSKVNQS